MNGGAWTAPAAGATAAVNAEGQTIAQFRTVDRAGNVSAWVPTSPAGRTRCCSTTSLPPPPWSPAGRSRGRARGRCGSSASGSTDARSGVDTYQYRESTNGGTNWSAPQDGSFDDVFAEGQTLVQFRAVDVAGNASAWAPKVTGPADTVRIDTTGPTVPTVTGGSLSWQKVTSLTITGSHSVDTGSGLNHYEHRVSTDGGITWSSAVLGPTQVVTAEGQTLVQVRAVDNAGNASAWAPQTVIPGATSRIDRTNPTDPTVGITPPGWHNVAAITVFAGAATDALSGVDHYQFRSSSDGGLTWTTPVNGATGVVTAEGSTLVQFRAVDAAGNMSNWAPAVGSAANTVRIDRTPPNAPPVTGGSLAWQTVAAVTLTASGSQDSPAGIDHYEYRTSTDGGDNWGDRPDRALGHHHRRGRDAGAVPRRRRRRERVGLGARRGHAERHGADRPQRPRRPHRHRRVAAVAGRRLGADLGNGRRRSPCPASTTTSTASRPTAASPGARP